MPSRIVTALVLALTASTVVSTQGLAQLAGTWALDQNAAKATGRGGVPGFPLASQLTIKTTPTEVSVDGDTGSRARFRRRSTSLTVR